DEVRSSTESSANGSLSLSPLESSPFLSLSKNDGSLDEIPNRSSLIEILGDAGSYSLCVLCSLLFNKYFPEQCHRSYIERCLKDLVNYYKLPSKVLASMRVMLNDGDCADLNSFIKLIYEEMAKKEVFSNQIVDDLIIFAVKDGIYDARLRVIIIKLSNFIGSSYEYLELSENSLAEMLWVKMNNPYTNENDEENRKRQKNKKIKRFALIALASIGGGTILGLTGGLSAPLIAAGAAALTSGAAILGTHAGIAIIGSLFGVAGAGLAGYKMNKRVGNIEEFSFEKLSDNRHLTITIAISGWITKDSPDAFSKPWLSLLHSQEQYSLRYESSYLLELGRALDYFLGFAISMAAQEALKFTLLSGIMAAIAWPTTLLTISSVIDNPWGVCISRSAEVGKFLADILLSREQGQRPVSLIGFSLGARVIFFCLEELATRKNCEGIIEDIVLLGAPVSASPERWDKFMPIISGKLINGYCRDDWLLKFLYRTSTATLRIAGLQPIDLESKKIVNQDLSDLIKGHMDYCKKLDDVLEKIGIRTEKNNEEKNEGENEVEIRDNINGRDTIKEELMTEL
ncbi:DUF726 domain-containing protein, partial [Sarcoptes scabiei]